MIRRYLPKSGKEFVHLYERYISPVSLVAGFVADNLWLLRRVDLWQGNALLFSYLVIAALGIIILNLIETGRIRRPWIIRSAPFISIVVQFSFGGLFSGYLSLYSRSAGFDLGLIFVILVAVLLLANERFTRLYVRFTFQMSVYFFVLFSFLIFFLPVVFRSIGPSMFIFAGLSSIALITFFLMALSRIVPEVVRKERTKVARSIAAIFLAFNLLYFAGAIPPLPLALKDSGVYHSVVRQPSGIYILKSEPEAWYQRFSPFPRTFHRAPGDYAYAFSAVFAPSGLSTIILHEWQWYDPALKEWVTADTQRFPILGGRDGGYRGYSMKTDLRAGKWRVNVVTQYGQLIGRISFVVEEVEEPVSLIDVER